MQYNTRRPIMLFALALGWTMPLAAQSAAGTNRLIGTWTMDTTKFEMHDRQLVALSLEVHQAGDTLVVVAKGQDVTGPPFTMNSRYLFETAAPGQPLDSLSHVGRVSWAGDTMVVHLIDKRPQRTLDIEERWLVQPDGTLARYQSVRDGPHLSRQTLVFSKTPR